MSAGLKDKKIENRMLRGKRHIMDNGIHDMTFLNISVDKEIGMND